MGQRPTSPLKRPPEETFLPTSHKAYSVTGIIKDGPFQPYLETILTILHPPRREYRNPREGPIWEGPE